MAKTDAKKWLDGLDPVIVRGFGTIALLNEATGNSVHAMLDLLCASIAMIVTSSTKPGVSLDASLEQVFTNIKKDVQDVQAAIKNSTDPVVLDFFKKKPLTAGEETPAA